MYEEANISLQGEARSEVGEGNGKGEKREEYGRWERGHTQATSSSMRLW